MTGGRLYPENPGSGQGSQRSPANRRHVPHPQRGSCPSVNERDGLWGRITPSPSSRIDASRSRLVAGPVGCGLSPNGLVGADPALTRCRTCAAYLARSSLLILATQLWAT